MFGHSGPSMCGSFIQGQFVLVSSCVLSRGRGRIEEALPSFLPKLSRRIASNTSIQGALHVCIFGNDLPI